MLHKNDINMKFIFSLIISLVFVGCNSSVNDSSDEGYLETNMNVQPIDTINNKTALVNEAEKKFEAQKKIEEKIIYHIPPPSGPGTGVCEASLTIENNFILATAICGGHDEHGRTESTEKLFKTEFKQNYKYSVSKVIKPNSDGDEFLFGCAYFEIKENKLYLYDENKKIINEWFCKYGNTGNKTEDMESCDCIFLPSDY